jgi:hypothetical protein
LSQERLAKLFQNHIFARKSCNSTHMPDVTALADAAFCKVSRCIFGDGTVLAHKKQQHQCPKNCQRCPISDRMLLLLAI